MESAPTIPISAKTEMSAGPLTAALSFIRLPDGVRIKSRPSAMPMPNSGNRTSGLYDRARPPTPPDCPVNGGQPAKDEGESQRNEPGRPERNKRLATSESRDIQHREGEGQVEERFRRERPTRAIPGGPRWRRDPRLRERNVRQSGDNRRPRGMMLKQVGAGRHDKA